MSTARLSNFGYLLMSKEATAGVAVAPTIALPLYDENVNTDGHFQKINPAYGSKFATYTTLPGMRSHNGDITVMFEPNTAEHLVNALLTQGTRTNSGGVYTGPYTLGLDSASYTFDVSLGNIVKRFIGVKASKLSIDWNDNEARAKLSISALSSFDGREIASITGAGPFVVTLKDPNGVFDGTPTKGLLVGDLIRLYDVSATASVADGAVTALTATTVTFTVSTGTTTAIAAGDGLQLRPVTPTYNNLTPFLWTKTRFCFGATASAALSAAHTPLEIGSEWEITHGFIEEEGSKRSGSFDPASLDRLFGDASFKIKKLTDTPEDLIAFKSLATSACVVRMYSGATNQYEFRLTLNSLVTDKPLGMLKSGELVFSEMDMLVNMNFTDGQAFDVKVLNALTTV